MRAAALLTAALLLLLSGCGDGGVRDVTVAREIEDLELIRAMGVDRTEDGVRVTLASAREIASGGEEKSGGGNEAVVLSQSAGTVSQAVARMQSFGSKGVFYGHIGSYLVGETLARDGIRDYLDYVERNPEMRLETDLYVIRAGTANGAIAAMTGEGYDINERLEFLQENADLSADTHPVTVRMFLIRTERYGSTICPALRLTEHREGDGARGDSALLPDGFAVLTDGRLRGYLDGEAAYGASLLMNETSEDTVTVTAPGGVRVALTLSDCRTRVRPEFDRDGTLTALRVTTRLRAGVDEVEGRLDLESMAVTEALCRSLETLERSRMEEALALAKSWNADCFGLGARAALAAPFRWREEAWSPAAVPVIVEVEAQVERSYDSFQSA
ncbi:MAG: spore gernimation protein GerC [Oscillospiraceae bacterium]|nr:spore gernimation protein GerC [Oscillospiraceae bacterium]